MPFLAVVGAAFALAFLAELPGKSMFAALVLGTRYRRTWVWADAAGAFAVQMAIAVSAGRLLALLPYRVVDVVAAVLFLAGSAIADTSGGSRSVSGRRSMVHDRLPVGFQVGRRKKVPAGGCPSAWRQRKLVIAECRRKCGDRGRLHAETCPGAVGPGERRDHCALAVRSSDLNCNFCNSGVSMTCMAAHDICTDIAAVLNPMPAPADSGEDEGWGEATAAAMQERDDEADQLRLAWEEGCIDPLLSTLAGLRAQRLRLEADTRLLIAYARRFTHPRPYKLIDLAEAAGMSISGARIAYDDDELDQLAELLGRPPVPSAGDDGRRIAPEG
jgi:Uncharacterized protein family UPF0016